MAAKMIIAVATKKNRKKVNKLLCLGVDFKIVYAHA